jgi:CheY-like chemotaxis protein
MNILLVEDNEVNQMVAAMLLRKWGNHVTIASDGREALNKVQEKGFDLILMDLQMPDMDGYESTHQIRAFDDIYFKTIPIFAYSASTMINTREKAMAFGMTDFINKPVRNEELQEKIDRYAVSVTYPNPTTLPLAINFDLDAEGDPAFQYELIHLLSENLDELQQSLNDTLQKHEPQLFQAGMHKASTALQILNNKDLQEVADEISSGLSQSSTALKEKITLFNNLCDYFRKALGSEMTRLGFAASR